MKAIKRILIVLAALLVIVQFIRPARNTSDGMPPYDISTKYGVPQEVQVILHTSCYDCHSNNTRYPWYAQVQPVGWFLQNDIQEGKGHLNFSEFCMYPARRQMIRLNDIIEQLTDEKMPLPSYLLIHTDARLSGQQRRLVIDWAEAMKDTIRARYPADSLSRRH